MNFLDAINFAKTKLFHFYTDPFSNFDDFTKLLQQSSDVFISPMVLIFGWTPSFSWL